MGFTEHSEKASSKKVIVAHAGPSQRLVGSWTQDGGDWYITAPHFVTNVSQDGVDLSSSAWTFNLSNYRLTITTATDPNLVFTNVTYRIFLSNRTMNLPYDLDTGEVVPYMPLIKASTNGGAHFDPNDIAGISIEGTSSIILYDDDFWEENFDGLNWQNKEIIAYSWGEGESVKLFTGLIKQSQKTDVVTFTIQNFLYKLRSEISLPLYSESDGDLPTKTIGKPKRRVYGRVQGLQPIALDPILATYTPNEIDGDDKRDGTAITVSGTLDTDTVTASSTDISDEIVAGDSITVETAKLKVESMARIDFGMAGSTSITYTISGTTLTISFTGLITGNLKVGDFVTIDRIQKASASLNNAISGIWAITSLVTDTSITMTVNSGGSTATVDTDDNELIITNDTDLDQFRTSSALPATYSGASVLVKPKYSYRRLNRNFNIAHHALSEVSTDINLVISLRRYRVDSTEGFRVGDEITITKTGSGLSYTSTIESINDVSNIIEVDTSFGEAPEAGDTLFRFPIQAVYHSQQLFNPDQEYEVSNLTTGSDIEFTTIAERDVSDEFSVGDVLWKVGSRAVLGSSSIIGEYQPRDWIKPNAESTWYEITEVVSDKILIISKPYSGAGGTLASVGRQPEVINDKSKVWVDTYGITDDETTSGTLLTTSADVIKHLLESIDLTVNEAAFDDSSIQAPYLMSLAIPEKPLGKSPKMRDIINYINTAVMANLYYNEDFEIMHTPLTNERYPATTTYIDDSHVLGKPQLITDSSKIYKTIIANYNFEDIDKVLEEESFSTVELDDDYVSYSGTSDQILTKDYPIFQERDINIIARKRLFIAEKPKRRVALRLPLEFNDLQLNDFVIYESDYLFERSTTGDKSLLGKISAINKTESTVNVTIDDVGNIFTRQGIVAETGEDDFDAASTEDKRFASFVTESSGLIDDDPTTIDTNLIG